MTQMGEGEKTNISLQVGTYNWNVLNGTVDNIKQNTTSNIFCYSTWLKARNTQKIFFEIFGYVNVPGKRNTLLFTGRKKLAPSRISRPSKLANCPVQKYARFRFCDVGLMLENIFRSSDVINYVGCCQMFCFARKPHHSICTTGLYALSSVVWYRKKNVLKPKQQQWS